MDMWSEAAVDTLSRNLQNQLKYVSLNASCKFIPSKYALKYLIFSNTSHKMYSNIAKIKKKKIGNLLTEVRVLLYR